MRPIHPVYRKIFRINRYTLNMSLPAEFLRRRGLGEGDEVELHEQEDGSMLLKFLKRAVQPQAEVEAVE
jgi:hypothetical protein